MRLVRCIYERACVVWKVGPDAVKEENFAQLLERLDECVAYVTINPYLKDAALYWCLPRPRPRMHRAG